jgi:hypothetical protein
MHAAGAVANMRTWHDVDPFIRENAKDLTCCFSIYSIHPPLAF